MNRTQCWENWDAGDRQWQLTVLKTVLRELDGKIHQSPLCGCKETTVTYNI